MQVNNIFGDTITKSGIYAEYNNNGRLQCLVSSLLLVNVGEIYKRQIGVMLREEIQFLINLLFICIESNVIV